MQKKLIALAVAGLASAPVFAQSNVTVYGIVDAFFGYSKYDDNKFTGIESGGFAGSRLGFRGAEDLGNGLKAVFTLEYGLEVDDNDGVGAGGSRSRQQFVGLQSNGWGFLGLGRQYAPGYFATAKYDAIPTVPFSPQFVLANSRGSNIVAGTAARVSNAVNYKSPNWGGLTVNAIYGFNEQNQEDNRQAGDLASVGVDYSNGPLGIGLVYSQVKQDAGAIATEKFLVTTADETKKEWYLGAGYDFGMVKLVASFQEIKDATAAEEKDKVWQLGAIVPVGAAGKVHVSYGRLDADADNSETDAAALLYSHGLSKRTTLYTGVSMVDNDDATRISSGLAKTTVEGTNPAQPIFGEKDKNFFVGVNHTF